MDGSSIPYLFAANSVFSPLAFASLVLIFSFLARSLGVNYVNGKEEWKRWD